MSIKGLKSEFDNNFPKSLKEANLLNDFQNQYLLETIDSIESTDSIINHKKSSILWNSYKDLQSEDSAGQYLFLQLHDLYQELFLSQNANEIADLKFQKSQLINKIDSILNTKIVKENRDLVLNNLLNLNNITTKIMNIQTSIYLKEKVTTDNFHSATLGMLICITLLVFGIIFSLSGVVLEFISRLNSYLKKLFDNATKELSRLNANLQNEVNTQVETIKQKDRLLYSQAKLASMGEMIQNIAHQWRQPLNSLMLVIQGLKMKFERGLLNKDSMEKQTKLALNIAQNMSGTIDNFRNFFRMDSGMQEFDVSVAIAEAIALNKPMLKSQNIIVHFESSEEILFFGSKDVLMQVLFVFFSNSKDAFVESKNADSLSMKETNSPPPLRRGAGGWVIASDSEAIHTKNIESKITNPALDSKQKIKNSPDFHCFINVEKTQDYVIINYFDNAGGIDEDIIDKIFEPYFTTKHKSSGTGVGLYMSRELVINHLRGEISAQNHTFSLESPLDSKADSKNTKSNSQNLDSKIIESNPNKTKQKGALFTLKLQNLNLK
ncbi:hypothetical protein DCO58_08580 [Helicobacter saguini]|uniref:histidine kinase n=2 Tax=Helicobacter saguini TaxID=1548018 RepID=A0A347VTT6_9HELI|nr:hypothetical protein [Helicobacter saguini]MWV67707.1 hypothetical protein [Helicobacter saguini]MWV70059.1 hypothetical protein [Helicobacter saguini]MWV72728.1 hypothetical protein [Helicobacter saguini]TLD92029.1 HAMP domain-containing histidine kinase [Helicobacter saguini]